MFDIFIKKSTIHVDCFTMRPEVFDHAPVVDAIETIPLWWKDLPKARKQSFFPVPTMKTCRGFIDDFSSGLVIPMWSDFVVKYTNPAARQFNWQFSDQTSEAKSHPMNQRTGFLPEYDHVKIESPWIFKSKSDTRWYGSPCFYNLNDLESYHVVPGVIDFKYQHTTNVNILFNKSFNIDFSQPLFKLTPLTEKKVKFKNHLVTPTEFNTLYRIAPTSFINSYLNQKRTVLKNEAKKCPFHSLLK